MSGPNSSQSRTWVDWLVAVLVLGYLSMTRSFAHLGLAPIYVGEVALGAILLARPRALLRPWLGSLPRSTPLGAYGWCCYGFLIYGIAQCLRGIAAGHSPMIAAQNLVFHVYPLFLFVGVWAGRRGSDALPSIVRALAWWHGLYGVAFILVLNRLFAPEDPFSTAVHWFGQPDGAAVVLLGLLLFERKLSRVWIPLLLNSFVLLAIQVRAAWLGLFVCLLLCGLLGHQVGRLARLTALIVGLLIVGLVVDLKIPSPVKRGGELSTRAVVARAVAAVDPKAATKLTQDADMYAGTVSWRTDWWREIWKSTHRTTTVALFGPGYGYPLWELHPQRSDDEPLRTPHNVLMYALGYTGWVGVFLFVGLQLAVAGMLWRTYRITGQPFGICYWAMIMVWANFDNFFETPYGAIPFFLLTGLAAAPLFGKREDEPS